MAAIPITRSISIDSDELVESFTRASGPGGQHVNTTDSAVLLRFDVAASPNLPEAVKNRLAELAGSRMTREGVLREAGYEGELRAQGDVLVDQLLPMRRCGFDSFAPEAPIDRATAEAALSRDAHFYQRAADPVQPVWKLRHG